MSRTYKTDEEFIAYTNGLDRGWKERGDLSRIEEFAAIRRAAEVAREHDRIAWEALAEWDELKCERHDENAEVIRDAIRAAIESPKQ